MSDNDSRNSLTTLPQVSSAEKYRAALLAGNFLVGAAVLVLLAIWITSLQFSHVKEVTPAGGMGDLFAEDSSAGGTEGEFEEPESPETFSDNGLLTPVSLENIDRIVKENQGSLRKIGQGESGEGESGEGETREIGPEIPKDGFPLHLSDSERWDIKFLYTDSAAYAAQLDQLGIELGALDAKTPRVDYVATVSQPNPNVRTGTRSDERRLFFRSMSVELQRFDRESFVKAGVKTHGEILGHFYPESLRAKLLSLEHEMLAGRSLKDVERTVFEFRTSENTCEIRVRKIEFLANAGTAD